MISRLNAPHTHSNTLTGHYQSTYLGPFYRSVVVGGVAIMLSQPVFAVTKLEHTFTPYVGSSHIYDSNVLRAPDDADLAVDETTGQVIADQKRVQDSFIHQIRAGLNVDWRYSRQQFIVKGEVNHNWFTGFDLDYLGHDVLAQWNWVAGSRLKGEIGYKHDQSLSSFAQLGGPLAQVLNNQQTEQRYFANAEYEIVPSIYFKAGFLRNEWSYGSGREDSNQTQNIGEFSLQYRNLSRTMLGFRVVVTDGTYQRSEFDIDSATGKPKEDPKNPGNFLLNPSDNAFLRTSYHIDGEWKYSDKLKMGGSAGYVQQDYQHISGLNFSDVVARFDLNWLSSEKTTLAFSAWREVNQAFTGNATFVLSTGVRVTPMWLPTSKIRLEMPLAFENQDYLGNPPDNKGGDPQSDEIVDLGLNFIYAPWINTEFAINVKHEDRSSSIRDRSYEAQSVGISAKVEF